MKPDKRFAGLNKDFWANVRLISQHVGYTVRGKNLIRVPTVEEMKLALEKINLGTTHLIDKKGNHTEYAKLLYDIRYN